MSSAEAARPSSPEAKEAAGAAGSASAPSIWRIGGWGLGLVLPLALAGIWELVVALGLSEGRLAPPPSRIVMELWLLASTGELFRHAAATLGRVALGFGFGAVAGILLGAATGAVPLLRRLLDPTVQALRSIPSLAWVPLFILWFGIFETSKVILIALGVFFPVYLGVMGAILSVDRKLLEVGQVFRLTHAQSVRRIMLPSVLPQTVIALRTGLGLGFMFVVAAEIMGASEGLGYLLVDGQQLGKPDQIAAAILAFALLGKAADALVARLSRPLLAWQDLRRTG